MKRSKNNNKAKIGWYLIILNLLGYVGCISTNKKIPINIFNIDELFEMIGFNLLIIIGIIFIIKEKNKTH